MEKNGDRDTKISWCALPFISLPVFTMKSYGKSLPYSKEHESMEKKKSENK